MTDIIERLRGIYLVKITDGLGPVGGSLEPNNPTEFVRAFPTAPIQHEAAAELERLRSALADEVWHIARLEACLVDCQIMLGRLKRECQISDNIGTEPDGKVVALSAIEKTLDVLLANAKRPHNNAAGADATDCVTTMRFLMGLPPLPPPNGGE